MPARDAVGLRRRRVVVPARRARGVADAVGDGSPRRRVAGRAHSAAAPAAAATPSARRRPLRNSNSSSRIRRRVARRRRREQRAERRAADRRVGGGGGGEAHCRRAELGRRRGTFVGNPLEVARPRLAPFVAEGQRWAAVASAPAAATVARAATTAARAAASAAAIAAVGAEVARVILDGSPPSSQAPSKAQLQSLAQKAPACVGENGGRPGLLTVSRTPQSAQS